MQKSILHNFWLSGGDPLQGLKPLMDVWYDGTIQTGELVDKSGNGNNATVSSNLVTKANSVVGDTGFFQSGGTAPTINSIITGDLAPDGTETLRFQWNSVPSFYLHRTHSFALNQGESVTITFWAKKVTSSLVTWIIRMGNGSTNGISSTLSAATYLIGGSQAVGSWGQYQATFTNTAPGGLGHFFLNGGTGTAEVLLDRDISVTVSGVSNTCFTMPNVAALKAADTKNHFYTAGGLPLTTRGDAQYNAFVKRIYCGGALSYIFLKAEPTISTYKILSNNFEDLDHAFDSCPIELTVGSGGTYALPQTAINIANTGDFRNRRRLKVLSDISVTTYAGYTVVSGGGFQSFIQMNKFFDYITSDGTQRTITATKEVSLNDAQSGGTEVLSPVYSGGIRGININKTNGGYVWHQDFTGSADGVFIVKDCNFNENGAQGIYDYRTANAQPQPAGQLSFNTLAGGMHNNFILKIVGTTLRGMRAYTWQDVACTSGNGGDVYMNNCTLESEIIYDPVSNPTSVLLENIRLTSSGGGRDTQIFMTNTTKNSTVDKVGASESIFLTEL